MTKRAQVSSEQNIWFDSQQVNDQDLTLEQQYNSTVTSAIISNNIGSGVIPDYLVKNILWDSSNVTGTLDGKNLQPTKQPSDSTYGNQLELNLTQSIVCGRKAIKVIIWGINFNDDLIFETFKFNKNESQISRNHFKSIITILINDFSSASLSLNLKGANGRLVISEAKPFAISRQALSASQNTAPNILFRDFFAETGSFTDLLNTSLAGYSWQPLVNVDDTSNFKRLVDTTTQVGQKFLIPTNNIQKISTLLSLSDAGAWSGDLVFSLYKLQTTISNPSDFIPSQAIDFAPDPSPIAQITFNQATLLSAGYVLDTTPQPVDFIFSNNNVKITPNEYYSFTIKRAGDLSVLNYIQITSSVDNIIENSKLTTFNGQYWVDSSSENLWYEVYSDAIKVVDGQLYDNGNGAKLDKVYYDLNTASNKDNIVENVSFSNNQVYTAIASAVIQKDTLVQDNRTGQMVYSKQQHVPQIDLFIESEASAIKNTTEPVILGKVVDSNAKYISTSEGTFTTKLTTTLFGNCLYFYKDYANGLSDTSFDALKSRIVSNNIRNSLCNVSGNTNNYRIANAEIITTVLGDVNGDGIIDENDITELDTFKDFDLNFVPPLDSTFVYDSGLYPHIPPQQHVVVNNGYSANVSFVADTGTSFLLTLKSNNLRVNLNTGLNGVLSNISSDGQTANFYAPNEYFFSLSGDIDATDCYLCITSGPVQNQGKFIISKVINDGYGQTVEIRKVILNEEKYLKIIRSDVNLDRLISSTDSNLLSNWIDREPSTINATTIPCGSFIGKHIEIIKLTLENLTDRNDDYSSTRSPAIHQTPDILLSSSGSLYNLDLSISPIDVTISSKISWNDYDIEVNPDTNFTTATFTSIKSNSLCDVSNITSIADYCSINKPVVNNYITDYFVPSNLILGDQGQIKKENGEFYKVDFEIANITFELPSSTDGYEKAINVFAGFVAENIECSGTTTLGFNALKFADGTFVDTLALSRDQVRFSVAVQSYYPVKLQNNNDPLKEPKVGVAFDNTTGVLKLNFKDLESNNTAVTLMTKVTAIVFLKKAGFNNQSLVVDNSKMANILGLSGINISAIDGYGDTSDTYKVKVSGLDTVPGFLFQKIIAGTGVTITQTYIGTCCGDALRIDVTPGAISEQSYVLNGNQDNYNPNAYFSSATIIRFNITTDNDYYISGFDASTPPEVSLKKIYNVSVKNDFDINNRNISFKHLSTDSLLGNRIKIPGGTSLPDFVIEPDDVVDIYYDATSSCWRLG